jgi:hypothetical protein
MKADFCLRSLSLVWTVCGVLALSACATPEPATVVADNDKGTCDMRSAPTGSKIVRKENCMRAATPEEREAARREAEALIDQRVRSQKFGSGPM